MGSSNFHKYITYIMAGIFLLLQNPLYSAEPATAESGMLIIHEIASIGDFEFIELKNITETPLIIDSLWYLMDEKEGVSDGDQVIQLTKGTIIPAKGFITIAPYKTSGLMKVIPKGIPSDVIPVAAFALGGSDSVTLVHENQIVDYYHWNTGINAFGRDPDFPDRLGAGAVQVMTHTLQPTPNRDNIKESYYSGEELPVKLNEICSKGIDFIELYNNSSTEYRFEKEAWTLHDIGKKDTFTIPEGTVIAAKSFLTIYPDLLRKPLSAPKNSLSAVTGSRFGLSEKDSVFLRYKGAVVEEVNWEQHVTSKGRFPDGSDVWVEDLIITAGKQNRK